MSLDLKDLPAVIDVGLRVGLAYVVTIVDERFTDDHVVRVTGCANVDDAVDAVVPYVNSNYLQSVKVRPA
jgi:ActR/RegA family two-component response regulator